MKSDKWQVWSKVDTKVATETTVLFARKQWCVISPLYHLQMPLLAAEVHSKNSNDGYDNYDNYAHEL